MELATLLPQGISPEIVTFFVGMLPLAELRLAIPMGNSLGLTPFHAFFYGTLGNIIIVLPIIFLLEKVSTYLSAKSPWFHRFFEKLFHKTRHKHTAKFDKYGPLTLILFVAIPLPGTGGWTGALASFVFGIPPKKAWKLITLGIIIAGCFVTLGWEGATKLASHIMLYHADISQ